MIDKILVVQGAELNSVKRGLNSQLSIVPDFLALPIGSKCVTRYLNEWQKKQDFYSRRPSRVLLMGLCGSLSGKYQPGDIVIYSDCIRDDGYQLLQHKCDPILTTTLTTKLQECLQQKASLVRGLTSARFISQAKEKQLLGKKTGAEVLDMESFAVLDFFANLSISVSVAMVRVVSDDCYYDLPDINFALTSSGNLQPILLAIAMLKQPLASLQLIRGASKGLKVLQQVTTYLFNQ